MRLTFTGTDSCAAETIDLRWRVAGDTLSFQLVTMYPLSELANERAWLETPWTAIQ